VLKIIFLLVLFFSAVAYAQLPAVQVLPDTNKKDTIFFLNGEIRAVKVIDTVSHLVRFLSEKKRRKPKVLEVEKDRLFSIKFSDGTERILYFHDSALGNVFTVIEAKMFMLGEQEAGKSYRNIMPAVIGFAVGAVSPVLLSNAVILSPVPAAVSPLHTLIPYIKINVKAIENKEYLQYDTYLMGYEKVARKKNFITALIGAGAGLATGFGIWAVLK
jgi:hypothetical protein